MLAVSPTHSQMMSSLLENLLVNKVYQLALREDEEAGEGSARRILEGAPGVWTQNQRACFNLATFRRHIWLR